MQVFQLTSTSARVPTARLCLSGMSWTVMRLPPARSMAFLVKLSVASNRLGSLGRL